MERAGQAQKKYFADLRSNAYIKVNDNYRPLVSPVLFEEERKDTPAAKEEAKTVSEDAQKEKTSGGKESSKDKTASKQAKKEKNKENR